MEDKRCQKLPGEYLRRSSVHEGNNHAFIVELKNTKLPDWNVTYRIQAFKKSVRQSTIRLRSQLLQLEDTTQNPRECRGQMAADSNVLWESEGAAPMQGSWDRADSKSQWWGAEGEIRLWLTPCLSASSKRWIQIPRTMYVCPSKRLI